MICIKEIDHKSILPCAILYQKVYKEAPWNEEYSIDEVTDYLNRFTNSKTKRAYMMLLEDEVIGITLGLLVPCIGSDYFRLEDICLDTEYQNRGLGSRFIQLLSERLLDEKCDSILLGTQKGYPAHRFYLKNDFQEIDSVLLYKSLGKL